MTTSGSLSPSEAAFILHHRVGRLATADATGSPHVVPVCFAFDGTRLYVALDEKPKRVPDVRLKRVRNLLERPEAALVVDHYTDEWSQLGYVLIHARVDLLAPRDEQHPLAVRLLRERYPQYAAMALEERLIIALTPTRVTSWGRLATSDELPTTDAGRPDAGEDFLALAQRRRSVRHFTAQPVSPTLIESVLDAARWAPSPHGAQPWRFAVVTASGVKARLAEMMAAEWQRNLEMDQQPADVVATRLAKSRSRVLNAPVLIVPCLDLDDLDHYPDPDRQRAEETMAVQSLGAAIQNLLLAAYSLGLDSGWMCAPLFCPDVVRAALTLDDRLIPHALIILGYAARDPVRRPRRPLDELVVYWE
jgi:coenzyme F420-0:L-glutamate ligase / coenzyme F420-1:gamma-L-glutamate ligase